MRKDLVARNLGQIISEINQLLEDGKTEEAKGYLSTMKEKLEKDNGRFLKAIGKKEREVTAQDYGSRHKRFAERKGIDKKNPKAKEKAKTLSGREAVIESNITASNSEVTTSALEKYLAPNEENNPKAKAKKRVADRALTRGKGKDKGKIV